MKPKKTPLYVKVRDFIKEQIENGKLKPGDQIPTEMELMDHFGVSRVTVTAAIKQLVEEGLVYRLAGKGTFLLSDDRPLTKPVKPSSTPRQRSVIGFIMRPASNAFTYRVLVGIEEACRQEGTRLLVRFSLNQEDEVLAIEEMLDFGVKGLIIHPLDEEVYNSAILQLKLSNFPFVLVDRYLPGINTNAVYSDNYSGGVQATEYLTELGHKSIGVVSSTTSATTSSEDRFQGYLDVVKRKKLPVQAHHWFTRIHDDVSLRDLEVTQKAIEEWVAAHRDITAVFAVQSYDAVSVIKAARKQGLRIPEDLSVLSFDNPGSIEMDQRNFTYIEQNLELMGKKAVELLNKAISDPGHIEHVAVPVRFVEGQSTIPHRQKSVK